MGGIRGFFSVIVSVILFFSILSLNLFGILSSSLTYETIQIESMGVVNTLVDDLNISSMINQYYPLILIFCQNNSEYVFSESDYVFTIPCDNVVQGPEKVLEEGIKSVIYNVYYGDYPGKIGDYLDNLQDSPFFLISQKAYFFTSKIFYYSLVLSIILLIALFFLVHNKSNAFLIPGIFVTLFSLLFLKFNVFFSKTSNGIISQFLGIFFSKSFPVSIRFLIVGIVFIVVAIVFKVFKVGFWISSFLEKFQKKEKPEIKKISEKKK